MHNAVKEKKQGEKIMDKNSLDITSLKNGVLALEEGIDRYKKCSADDVKIMRSGVVKNFEVAYELCWKFMKRWLEINAVADIEVLMNSRREFYRIAAQNHLISDVKIWWSFHESRNKTVHIYDGTIADEVLETAINFLPYAKTFVSVLEGQI
jgi:nucleotidyltransferase substrate binding protein (TIGR01987 family)